MNLLHRKLGRYTDNSCCNHIEKLTCLNFNMRSREQENYQTSMVRDNGGRVGNGGPGARSKDMGCRWHIDGETGLKS
jgi:hypothetical protein